MQVNIRFHDNTSFTKEEVVRQALHHYGSSAEVEVTPDSTNAHDFLYFGIQQIITHDQISLMFERGADYPSTKKKLRAEVLLKLEEILDSVINDNEQKVAN